MSIVLFRLAARAQYHLMRGDEAKSWHWISRFVESMQNARTAHLSPTTLPAYQTLFDVLLHFKRADLVLKALAVVRDWAKVHPVCSSAVEHYLQLANAQTALPVSVPVNNPIPSRRCDAYLTSPSDAAVHVTDARAALQANVDGLCPSDRFVSVTGSRHQQLLSAGQQPMPTTTAFEHLVEGHAWGYAGRDSQDIVQLASPGDTTSAAGRESWSGGVSLDVDERPPPIGVTVSEPGGRGLQRLLEGVRNSFGGGGHKDGRSSFDWSAFLQDLETNNT